MQSFKAKVSSKEHLTDDMIKLSISAPEDFSFKAGQFVTFMIEKDGVKKPRSYSIFDYRPENKQIIFIIKIVEGGFAGNVFKETKEGNEFEVKGPFGHFTFDDESKNEEHWFIGCGCGLAPLYNMIKANLAKFPAKKFTLLFSVKYKKDLIFDEELKGLEAKHDNFTYMPTLTREEWEGKTGRVQKHLPEDAKDKTFYICGLKELVLDTKEYLLNKEVNPSNIRFERYS